MAPTLYITPASPPARAVLMTAKALGLELTLKKLNVLDGDNLKPEYLKLNPQHTIPTLVDDDGFVIWESHAIMAYLVSKFGKDDALYPKDLKKRALVDQRLHFETGVMFVRLIQAVGPIFRGTKNALNDTDKETLDEAYGFLEAFLEGRQWMAGENVTIADYSLLSSVSSITKIHPIDSAKYPKTTAWLKKGEALSVFEVNKEGLAVIDEVVKTRMV